MIELTFLSAVALAGVGFLAGDVLVSHSAVLRKHFVPEPLVGGLLVAAVLLGLRAAGHPVDIPKSGREIDFLVALLTTNMGLHLTRSVLRNGFLIFLLMLLGGVLLYFTQLLLILPLAAHYPTLLPAAVLLGPISFVGAPFNLNPPAQIPPIEQLLTPPFADPGSLGQGLMMAGVLLGSLAAAVLGRHLFAHVGEDPPKKAVSRTDTRSIPEWEFATHVTIVIVVVLSLIVGAFALQNFLLDWFPNLRDDHVPVIVLSYLLGGLSRWVFDHTPWSNRFPEEELRVLLLGPTMGFVLTYSIMSLPLHFLGQLSGIALAAPLFAVTGSVVLARLSFPLLRRLTESYYAAVIAIVFLVVTTAWGAAAMCFLRRYMGMQGRVEPMPAILPLNAFFLFPWLAILLTRLVFYFFDG